MPNKAIIADFFARFKKIDGYNVHFLTGTEETLWSKNSKSS